MFLKWSNRDQKNVENTSIIEQFKKFLILKTNKNHFMGGVTMFCFNICIKPFLMQVIESLFVFTFVLLTVTFSNQLIIFHFVLHLYVSLYVITHCTFNRYTECPCRIFGSYS